MEILLFIFIVLMALILQLIIIWWATINPDDVMVTFSIFKKMYDFNPGRFDLRYEYIYYDISPYYSIRIILATPIDYFRYKIFLHNINKQKAEDNRRSNMEAILSSLQYDANNLGG